MRPIPYGRQSISKEDINAVVDVLRSDWLTQGPAIERFERAVAAYVHAGHAVAACNATAVLHLACRALGVGPGDRVWTTPNTFVASANCGLYCGAAVDFVDIDPCTYNMCARALSAKLEKASREGRLPKVVIPVHFAGQSCDMAAIAELARRYSFSVIEDASHAIGASYQGSAVGAGVYSDITVFSFHPVKIITTGEGGLATTNREDLARSMALLRTHGITRDPARMSGETEGPWYYQQVDLGHNYRMTDLQAALGESQLQRVDEFVARRRMLADRYNKALASMPLRRPVQKSDARSAWHLYVIQLELEQLHRSRREIVEAMREEGVEVNVHYIPVHLHPWYRQLGFREGDFPIAEDYYRRAMTLPLYFGMSEEQQDFVVAQLKNVLN